MVFQEQVVVSTRGHGDMHDVTDQVAALVTRSGVRTGVVQVFKIGRASCRERV